MQRLSEIGEKVLIREFIKPFFNGSDDPAGVGDDCAMVPCGNTVMLFSTDRVPANLTAFTHGILTLHGLGDYAARLNLSDLAACGGSAIGLLLNLGLPDDFSYEDVRSLCSGFRDCAERHGATVLGGDITNARELSISATSIGKADVGRVLTRRAAKPGDSIFVSRPLGLTPAAFSVFRANLQSKIDSDTLRCLMGQFTDMQPMLTLGTTLGASEQRGACMDNTDGVGQTLSELSEASKCALIIDPAKLQVHPVVDAISKLTGAEPIDFMFGAGADFSLVGTIRGEWSNERAESAFGQPIQIIGRVVQGEGVWFQDGRRLTPRGWNYFYSEDIGTHSEGT